MKALVAILAVWMAFGAAAGEEYAYDRWLVGGTGGVLLPQGGGDLRRLGGGGARVGYYFAEMAAVEIEGVAFENTTGLAVRGLWHWWGYERLDPFFTYGVRGWIGDSGEVGPSAGLGAFWHLTEAWSLRADADFTLGLESDVEVGHVLSLSLLRSF